MKLYEYNCFTTIHYKVSLAILNKNQVDYGCIKSFWFKKVRKNFSSLQTNLCVLVIKWWRVKFGIYFTRLSKRSNFPSEIPKILTNKWNLSQISRVTIWLPINTIKYKFNTVEKERRKKYHHGKITNYTRNFASKLQLG